MDQQENKKEKKQEDLTLHDILIKQQALLLQQSEYIAKEKQRKKEEADEIDLSRLVPGFLKKKKERKSINIQINKDMPKNFVGKTVLFFDQQIRFIFRNKFILSAFLIIGLGYGVYVKLFTPKVYESTMTVAAGTFANTYYSSLLFSLEKLAKGGSYVGLANKLAIDTVIAQNIISIEYLDYLTKDRAVSLNDSTLEVINRPFFKITINTFDNNILPEFQNGIFNYLNGNSYVNMQIEIRKETLAKSIKEMKNETLWFDSLKMAVIQSLRDDQQESNKYKIKETGLAGGGIILSQDNQVQIQSMEPFNKSAEIINKIIAKERELLQLDNNFYLVDGFSANYSPVYPTLKHTFFYSIYGFILGLILIYGIQILKFIYSFKPD